MSDIYRRLMVDQERFNKLTNPLGDLDKIANPAGSAITQLSAAVTATDVFAKNLIPDRMLADIYGTGAFSKLGDALAKQGLALEGPGVRYARGGILPRTILLPASSQVEAGRCGATAGGGKPVKARQQGSGSASQHLAWNFGRFLRKGHPVQATRGSNRGETSRRSGSSVH